MKFDEQEFAEKIRLEQRARQEACRILDVAENAGDEELKKAYRKACLRHHPDHNPGDRESNYRFLLVRCAYELLTRNEICPALLEKMRGKSSVPPKGKYNIDNPWGYFLWWREGFFDDPPPSDEIVEYARSCKSDFWQAVFHAEADYLIEHLKGCRKMLSVGCGPADIESILREHGFQITGLDVSHEALGRAPDGMRKVVGRAEDMSFEKSSFDAVIYVASMQFIEDYRTAIGRTYDVLRPGGRLIAMLLNPASAFFRQKMADPTSYIRRIRHADISGIGSTMARYFSLRTEYFLGISETEVYKAQKSTDAVLYIIDGTKMADK